MVPTVECRELRVDGAWVWFGYSNDSSAPVVIPVSRSDNKITPAPQDRGQETYFKPGRISRAFAVLLKNPGNHVWRLRSPNGVTKTATANASTPLCPLPTLGDYNDIDVSRVCERPEARVSVNGELVGTPGNDVLCGGPAADRINGLGGVDWIIGRAGNDFLIGGDGDDVIFGGDGDDTVDAGGGNDIVDVGNGSDTVTGGSGDDWLLLGAGSDRFDAGEGDDDVRAGGSSSGHLGTGIDVFEGGPGIDVVNGGAEYDYLDGAAGADLLQGGDGRDHLVGGDGVDVGVGGLGVDECETETATECEPVPRIPPFEQMDATAFVTMLVQTSSDVERQGSLTAEEVRTTKSRRNWSISVLPATLCPSWFPLPFSCSVQ